MSMDDRPKHLDALLAHVAENLPDDEAAIASPADTLAAQEQASTARAAALIAPIEAKVREHKGQERTKIRRDALLEGADIAMALDFEQLRRGDTEFLSFEHAWNLGTVDVSQALRRLARPDDFGEQLTKPERAADTIDRIAISRSVRYAVKGAPEVPDEYNETRTIAPTEITLTYRAAPDSELGRVHAYVKGWWMQDGARVLAEAVGRHFSGHNFSAWPAWLAAEARLHGAVTS